MVELHDWHNAKGQERGAGFIVAGIRSKEPYSMPRGFRPRKNLPQNSRIRPMREKRKPREDVQPEKENSALKPFFAFWKTP